MSTPASELEALKAKIAELEKVAAATPTPDKLRLDIGCGPNKKEGFHGVDITQFKGVDTILDSGSHKWPWADDSVDEVHCSHMLEHLTWEQRVFFFNELHRVLKKGATAIVIIPHWCSNRYYGDPSHKSPMSEMAWAYLSKDWRKVNAPHVDMESAPGPLAYSCDFDTTYGFSMASWMMGRSAEFIQFALSAYKEAAQDMMATLIKK
jgi:SAM-dependent methyltransferase